MDDVCQQIEYLMFIHRPIQHQIQPLHYNHYECELLQTPPRLDGVVDRILDVCSSPDPTTKSFNSFHRSKERCYHHSYDGGAYPKLGRTKDQTNKIRIFHVQSLPGQPQTNSKSKNTNISLRLSIQELKLFLHSLMLLFYLRIYYYIYHQCLRIYSTRHPHHCQNQQLWCAFFFLEIHAYLS